MNIDASFGLVKPFKYSGEQGDLIIILLGILVVILLVIGVGMFYHWKKMKQEKKIVEAENLRNEAMLLDVETAVKTKSEFLANISHEIRTPMNAMLGYAELLSEQTLDPKFQNYVDAIIASGKNLQSLLNDILDLSKMDAGKMELFNEPVNFLDLCKEVVEVFRFKALDKKINLNLKSFSDSGYYFWADEIRLKQILMNLLSNSMKFTMRGEITISVEITKHKENQNAADITLKVSDTGIGIQSKDKEKVFEAFYQQRPANDTADYGGTGLGLTITRLLVQKMNGSITIDSEHCVGTIITIQLPLVKKADEIETEATADNSGNTARVVFDHAKIMLAEDNEINRRMIRIYLAPFDFEIMEAVNGKQALFHLSVFKPDLVLMDINMPGMDGLQTLAEIRRNAALHRIPVIATTAYQKEMINDKMVEEFDGYLLKPLSKKRLIDELKKFLSHRSEMASVNDETPNLTNNKSTLLSVEIRERIESELMEKWRLAKKLMSKDEIEDFALLAKTFGEKNDIASFVEWAETVNKYAAEFNIRNLYITFNKFGEVVNLQ